MVMREATERQRQLAEASLIDDVLIEAVETEYVEGGRLVETGRYVAVDRTKGRVSAITRNADPSVTVIAERVTGGTASILAVPLTAQLAEGHRVTVQFARGGSRVMRVLGLLPNRTHATLTRAVCEEALT